MATKRDSIIILRDSCFCDNYIQANILSILTIIVKLGTDLIFGSHG